MVPQNKKRYRKNASLGQWVLIIFIIFAFLDCKTCTNYKHTDTDLKNGCRWQQNSGGDCLWGNTVEPLIYNGNTGYSACKEGSNYICETSTGKIILFLQRFFFLCLVNSKF